MTDYRRFQTEAQLMAAIKNNATQLGYLVYHTRYSIGSPAGFPDLVICGHGATFYVECKGPNGDIKPKQQRWIEELQAAGQNARFAWSTKDDDFDAIMRDLEEAYERDHHATQGGRP